MLQEETGADGGDSGDTELPDAVAARVPPTLRADDEYRSFLGALIEHDGACSLSTLTRTLVDEAGWSPDGDATNPYQQTYIALVREYVPVLVEFSVIEYDEELGTVGLVGAGSP